MLKRWVYRTRLRVGYWIVPPQKVGHPASVSTVLGTDGKLRLRVKEV